MVVINLLADDRGAFMTIDEDKLETLDAWGEALDYKVDVHLQLIHTKDPVKRKKLEMLYRKADRICNILAKDLCTQK